MRPNGKFRGTDEERIDFIVGKIETAFRKVAPDFVLIEGYSFASKGRALSGLHELGGVVKSFLWRQGGMWTVLPPTSLKMDATGNGGADKEAMLRVACKLWPECPKYIGGDNQTGRMAAANIADAYLLADYGIQHYRNLCESM